MGSSQRRARRDRGRLLAATVVYVPGLLLAQALGDAPPPVPALLLLVPFLAGLAMIHFGVQSVRHGDELQRLVHLQALAFAFVGLAVLCFTLALLPLGLPSSIGWIDLWVVMSTLWLVGLGLATWRHR